MRSYYSRLGRINSLEPAMAVLTDEQLKGMTGVGWRKCGARRCGAGKCGATVMGERLKGMTGVGRGEGDYVVRAMSHTLPSSRLKVPVPRASHLTSSPRYVRAALNA